MARFKELTNHTSRGTEEYHKMPGEWAGKSDMGRRSITAHTVDVKLYTCVDWERNV